MLLSKDNNNEYICHMKVKQYIAVELFCNLQVNPFHVHTAVIAS